MVAPQQCMVLRCGTVLDPSARVIEVNESGRLRRTAIVCADHGRRMDDGAPWRWSEGPRQSHGPYAKNPADGASHGTVLMGDDLDAYPEDESGPPAGDGE